MAKDTIGEAYIGGIVGNKNDLYLQAKITEEDAKKFAENKKMEFKLVSAKEAPQCFEDILIDLVKKYKVPEEQMKKTVLNNAPMEKKKRGC